MILKKCVWVFPCSHCMALRITYVCFMGFDTRKLQDFSQFAAYKMQKNNQNVTLFISYQPHMYVRTSQMRANYILKRRFQMKIAHTYRNPYGRS